LIKSTKQKIDDNDWHLQSLNSPSSKQQSSLKAQSNQLGMGPTRSICYLSPKHSNKMSCILAGGTSDSLGSERAMVTAGKEINSCGSLSQLFNNKPKKLSIDCSKATPEGHNTSFFSKVTLNEREEL
jgi:hypothetical protein